MVSCSGTSCTVQRTSSVVGKTCRTNENKNIHLLPPHQLCELTSSAETDALSDVCQMPTWAVVLKPSERYLNVLQPDLRAPLPRPLAGKLHQLLLQFIPQFSLCPGGTSARWLG